MGTYVCVSMYVYLYMLVFLYVRPLHVPMRVRERLRECFVSRNLSRGVTKKLSRRRLLRKITLTNSMQQLNRKSHLVLWKGELSFVDVISHNQCDQIWRNFATWAKFKKFFCHFLI